MYYVITLVLAALGIGLAIGAIVALAVVSFAVAAGVAVILLVLTVALFAAGVARGIWYEITDSWPEEKLERWRKEGRRVG